MRISKLRVRDFLSLKDTGEVSLDPSITLLLGKNENGKTNLLLALESFDRDSAYGSEDLCRYSDTKELVIRGELLGGDVPLITLWFTLDSKDKRRLGEIDKTLREAVELEVTKHLDNHYRAKAVFADGKTIALADEQWGDKVFLQEVLDDAVHTLSILDVQLAAHGARHLPFAESLEAYRRAVREFEAKNAELGPPKR